MNEIEVGEYVRTNTGYISKLKRIEFDDTDKSLKWYYFDKKESNINNTKEVCINKPYITKHSKNILDIVEVGDYINGDIVNQITKNYISVGYITIGKRNIKNIRTILTHEQYEQYSYKVVE